MSVLEELINSPVPPHQESTKWSSPFVGDTFVFSAEEMMNSEVEQLINLKFIVRIKI